MKTAGLPAINVTRAEYHKLRELGSGSHGGLAWSKVQSMLRDRGKKTNLDIFWLKDDSLEDASNLPPPDIIAAEIIENLEAALDQFRSVAEQLQRGKDSASTDGRL